MSEARSRLERLLGGAELAALRMRLRQRYQRARQAESFTLGSLEARERQALEGLLGRPSSPAASIRLSLAELDLALARAGLAPNLRAALEALDGVIEDHDTRQQRRLAWQQLVESVADPRLRTWLGATTARGVLKRLAGGEIDQARELLRRCEAVIARLPAQGLPLAELAALSCHDAHALDAGRATASLVLAVLRPATSAESEVPEALRQRWASLGVVLNELAAPALLLNLSADGEGAAAGLLRRAYESAEPLHLSLRALLRDPPRWSVRGRTVFVCENPTVLARAADRLGTTCQPLVCTEGMPGTAPQVLLRQLAEAGACLRYHGDFDWPGIGIGNLVISRFGAQPWRFGASDYRRAADHSSLALEGEPAIAGWDGELSAVMRELKRAVHEEAVLQELLSDLALD
jgi:uncharacterized protein (TIGR02679 family)